jgi:hypothetical protein
MHGQVRTSGALLLLLGILIGTAIGGFGLTVWGANINSNAWAIAGITTAAASTVLFLIALFISMARTRNVKDSVPSVAPPPALPRKVPTSVPHLRPKAPPATRANFQHLLDHTLEGPEGHRAPSNAGVRVEMSHRAATTDNGDGTVEFLPVVEASAPVPPAPLAVPDPPKRNAVERRPEMVKDLPILRAVFAEADLPQSPENRTGKTRGKCSSCSTLLWAPARRPIKLRCPKCGHTATLEA